MQVRSLGQQSSNALELNTLSEALAQLKLQIHPQNLRSFQVRPLSCFFNQLSPVQPSSQDNVEVHMKQIHSSMLQQTEQPGGISAVL